MTATATHQIDGLDVVSVEDSSIALLLDGRRRVGLVDVTDFAGWVFHFDRSSGVETSKYLGRSADLSTAVAAVKAARPARSAW